MGENVKLNFPKCRCNKCIHTYKFSFSSDFAVVLNQTVKLLKSYRSDPCVLLDSVDDNKVEEAAGREEQSICSGSKTVVLTLIKRPDSKR